MKGSISDVGTISFLAPIRHLLSVICHLACHTEEQRDEVSFLLSVVCYLNCHTEEQRDEVSFLLFVVCRLPPELSSVICFLPSAT